MVVFCSLLMQYENENIQECIMSSFCHLFKVSVKASEIDFICFFLNTLTLQNILLFFVFELFNISA